MQASRQCSILVPAYNEEAIIDQTVRRLHEHLSSSGRFDRWEILLLDNASQDRTPDIGQKLAQELGPCFRYIRIDRKGLGRALSRGLHEARYDRVVLTAADLPFGLHDLEQFWAADPDLDVVIGSKALAETVDESPLGRKILSRAYRLTVRVILGLRTRDPQGTFFLRRSAVLPLLSRCDAANYFFTTQLVLQSERASLRIQEVPVHYERPRKGSRVHPVSDGVHIFLQVLRERLRDVTRPRG